MVWRQVEERKTQRSERWRMQQAEVCLYHSSFIWITSTHWRCLNNSFLNLLYLVDGLCFVALYPTPILWTWYNDLFILLELVTHNSNDDYKCPTSSTPRGARCTIALWCSISDNNTSVFCSLAQWMVRTHSYACHYSVVIPRLYPNHPSACNNLGTIVSDKKVHQSFDFSPFTLIIIEVTRNVSVVHLLHSLKRWLSFGESFRARSHFGTLRICSMNISSLVSCLIFLVWSLCSGAGAWVLNVFVLFCDARLGCARMPICLCLLVFPP